MFQKEFFEDTFHLKEYSLSFPASNDLMHERYWDKYCTFCGFVQKTTKRVKRWDFCGQTGNYLKWNVIRFYFFVLLHFQLYTYIFIHIFAIYWFQEDKLKIKRINWHINWKSRKYINQYNIILSTFSLL